MKNLIQIMLLLTVTTLVGCLDMNIPEYSTSTNAKKMDELRVSPDFDWTTAQSVQVTITGLPIPDSTAAVKSTLLIKGLDDTYYSGFHAINEDITLVLTVPSTEKIIHLKFGSIEQDATIVDSKANFSFIPTVTDQN